jgi:hypothetical protein
VVPIDCPQLLQGLYAGLNRHLHIQHHYLDGTQFQISARSRSQTTMVCPQQIVLVLAQCLFDCVLGKLYYFLSIDTIVALVLDIHPPSQAFNNFQVNYSVISYHD